MDTTRSGIPLAVLNNDEFIDHQKTYINQKVILEPGSKIVLYADGLTEAVNSEEKECNPAVKDFEQTVLVNAMLELYDKPSEIFIEEIIKRLFEFRGNDKYEDDVCLICMDIPLN